MLRYYYGIFKKLTPLKVLNYFGLVAGFHISRLLRRPVQLGMPVFISVEPTTSCNLRCPQCPSGLREFTRPTGMLDRNQFDKMISQFSRTLHSLTFYFQGEPYLHPQFTEMVKEAGSRNIFTITSTNGHYLNPENAKKTIESGLDKLIISLDGITQEVYEKYRVGGQLHKCIEGTKEIITQKRKARSSTPHVVWQFVVFSTNEHQVDEIKALGKELGVDEVKIKTAQIYDFENGHDLIPTAGKYSRYTKDASGTYAIKNELTNQCWRMWQGCVITWDGKIVPCCFDKDAHHQIGNLQEQNFRDIWFSSDYNRFRQSVLHSRKDIDICTNCSEGTRVFD